MLHCVLDRIPGGHALYQHAVHPRGYRARTDQRRTRVRAASRELPDLPV
jgi:hypothetical protein